MGKEAFIHNYDDITKRTEKSINTAKTAIRPAEVASATLVLIIQQSFSEETGPYVRFILS